MSGSILCELEALQRQVPGPDASPAEIGAWYADQGELLACIAAEGGPDAGEVLELSRAAYGHAETLTKGETA